jgi:hypothetical protein
VYVLHDLSYSLSSSSADDTTPSKLSSTVASQWSALPKQSIVVAIPCVEKKKDISI